MTNRLHRHEDFNILIADDDEACRDSLRMVLEPEGYETYLASNGEEAVYIVRHEIIHVAILDMHMPGLTGLETVRLIKQIRQSIPCVFITGDQSKELRISALSEDVFTVVTKPVSTEMLRYTVDRVIEKFYWPEEDR